jgi:hypothetical protein
MAWISHVGSSLPSPPQEWGGSRLYASGLPDLHTQGDALGEATMNAQDTMKRSRPAFRGADEPEA